MTDKQREATKIVLQQCSKGHLDAEESLKIIDSIVSGMPQEPYVPDQSIDSSPTSWDYRPYYQIPNNIYSVTYEQGGVTVGHTDTPNGGSVTTKGNVAMHYTNGKRKHHGGYEWEYAD